MTNYQKGKFRVEGAAVGRVLGRMPITRKYALELAENSIPAILRFDPEGGAIFLDSVGRVYDACKAQGL